MQDLLPELEQIGRRVFGDPDLRFTLQTKAEAIRNWDSLRHIEFMVAIEERFGVSLSLAELTAIRQPDATIGDLVDLLRARLEYSP